MEYLTGVKAFFESLLKQRFNVEVFWPFECVSTNSVAKGELLAVLALP